MSNGNTAGSGKLSATSIGFINIKLTVLNMNWSKSNDVP